MDARRAGHSFDFGISYAGSDRSIAEALAALLSGAGAVVFIDTPFRAHLVGRRLDREFEWVFGRRTRYFVAIISQAYLDRPWAQHEWSIAIREAESRSEEFILPLRLDDSLLVGLPSTVGYVDLRQHSIEEVAALLMEKLAGARSAGVTNWVATFGILVQEVLNSGELPPTAPTDYPHLCDWLAEDLLARLSRSSATNPWLSEDSRNGETFSVRVVFHWKPQERPLEFGTLDWWDVLEVLPYDRVYEAAE